ncbi:MAG: hypothetical protein KKE11_02255, partial [Gammaproteobacteria bacterium]|nr:hypothetical protein [Gammaproteobacteria bacterium]
NFDYLESGILDKTHLHFYTVKTAMNLVQSVGLTVKKIYLVLIILEYWQIFPNILVKFLGITFILLTIPENNDDTIENSMIK